MEIFFSTGLACPPVLSIWEIKAKLFFKNAPYSSLFASHLFLNLFLFQSSWERDRECSITRSLLLWILTIDPCVFKVTLALSSPPTQSPASGGLLSSMNALLMLSLSLEDLIVPLLPNSHQFLYLISSRVSVFCDCPCFLLFNLFPLCRGHPEDHHESHGCKRSHSLPSQEPSPGLNTREDNKYCVLLLLLMHLILSWLDIFSFPFPFPSFSLFIEIQAWKAATQGIQWSLN